MSLIIEGLANTIHDILYINQNCLSYYDGSDYSQYMDFYYYALKGLSSSTLSLIQTTNKWNDKFIYSKKLADFQKGYVELRSLFNTCWKGNKTYFNTSNMCPRIEIARGRPFFNVFKNASLEILLGNKNIDKYFNILLDKNKINYDQSINYLKYLWTKEHNLISPEIFTTAFNNRSLNYSNNAKACKHCWQIFVNEQSCLSEYECHPCFLSVENRASLNNQEDSLVYLYDPIFMNYLRDSAKTFSPSQKEAANIGIDGSSNLWIYGEAGFGKSYITDWLVKMLITRYGPEKVLICAMTKVSSKVLCNGRTIHSLFKLGTLNIDIYQYIHRKDKTTLQAQVTIFINRYYNTFDKVKELLEAKVLVIDEVVQLTKELHDFLNELFELSPNLYSKSIRRHALG